MLSFLSASSTYTVEPLLGGMKGIEQTIRKIRSLVDEAWRTLDVRALAIDILRNAGAPQFDEWAQNTAIYNWVRNYFYFVNDPLGKEVLMPFNDLLNLAAGDCDEINAIAMSVLLGAIGREVRLVTVAASADDPSQFSHIYTEVLQNGNWIPMDAARPGAQMGQAPASFYRREWWSLTEDEHGDYPGRGQLGQYQPMRTHIGLGAYRDLGQDDGISDLPLPPITSPPLEPLPPINPADLAPSSSGDGLAIARAIGSGFTAIATPVLSVVKNAIGPGGSKTIAPTGGTAVVSNPFASVNANTLLMGGLVVFGGIILIRAMSKK